MAKAAINENSTQKTVPADCVSVLLMALGNTTITRAQYDMMSALDGSRTASSFEHQFRSVTARAKELKARVDSGEKFQPVQTMLKRCGGTAFPATPKKRKSIVNDNEETPAKKKKATPKKGDKKATADAGGPTNELGSGDDLSEDMNKFIKNEQDWETEFV